MNATKYISSAIAIAILAAQPAPAQFLGIGKKKAESSATEQCQQSETRKQRNSIFGSIAGSIAGSALGSAGASGMVVGLASPIGSLLTSEILSKLDCKEQVQAAKATDSAVRGGVGSSSAWASESRQNVSGSSTVTGEDKLADGSSCVTVTDVVIVEGEETTALKRMCRKPGESGYTLAA